jgi:hypothetical protein
MSEPERWYAEYDAAANKYRIRSDYETIAAVGTGLGITQEEHARRAHLVAAAPLLLAELRRLEWGVMGSDGAADCCPACDNDRVEGHAPDCTLAAALRAVGEGPDVAPQ